MRRRSLRARGLAARPVPRRRPRADALPAPHIAKPLSRTDIARLPFVEVAGGGETRIAPTAAGAFVGRRVARGFLLGQPRDGVVLAPLGACFDGAVRLDRGDDPDGVCTVTRWTPAGPGASPAPREGTVTTLDFEAECLAILAREEAHEAAGGRSPSAVAPGLLESRLLVRFALDRGDDDLAGRLATLAARISGFDPQAWAANTIPAEDDPAAYALALRLRAEAVRRTEDGLPEEDLPRWSLIAAMRPPTTLASEAAAMYGLLRQRADRDRDDPAPREAALRALPPAERARALVRRLRDRAPAGDLVALGWEAVPALIEHLDDPEPTREVARDREDALESWRVVRVGEACQDLLDAVLAGESARGADLRDLPEGGFHERISTTAAPFARRGEARPRAPGAGPGVRLRAQEWWEARPERRRILERQLDAGAVPGRTAAARALLVLEGAERAAPAICTASSSAPLEVQVALAEDASLGRHLLPRLDDLAAQAPLPVAARAARARLGLSGRRAAGPCLRALTDRVEAACSRAADAGALEAALRDCDGAFTLLGEIGAPEGARAVVAGLRVEGSRSGAALEAAGRIRTQRTADALASSLGDAAPCVGAAGPGRACDVAAESLARLLDRRDLLEGTTAARAAALSAGWLEARQELSARWKALESAWDAMD